MAKHKNELFNAANDGLFTYLVIWLINYKDYLYQFIDSYPSNF